MPQKGSALRRRIAPSVPLAISFEDENGKFSQIYRVSFDLNVLAEIEEKTGLKSLTDDIWKNLDANLLRAMLWAALLPKHPEFDTQDRNGPTNDGLETVGSWLDAENGERAIDSLGEAYLLYLPKKEADRIRENRRKQEAGEQLDPTKPATGIPETESSASSGSGRSAGSTSESPRAISAS